MKVNEVARLQKQSVDVRLQKLKEDFEEEQFPELVQWVVFLQQRQEQKIRQRKKCSTRQTRRLF